MAENKMGPNIQAGAGFLAKRVQKSLSRAQEKVLQKLGKTMETKDEQFEQCFQNLNKQQTDGGRLYKDVKAYHTAVKTMHESSKRLSQTLRDVYESDWMGGEDLSLIMESEDLLWNDYEEKLTDQIVRTMENYTSQFPEVKERVAKRGRKLVDYDSARHHLEALQSAKKKDDSKISKAEEEFNKAQNVFEEINNELRDELPVLHQSRIGCYVTVFQNVSNLRDVFYKEMSVLNHDLYNVMKKLETQHSGKAFIIKGLNSTKSAKNRKSLVISNPIPCNTAFPNDYVSLHHPTSENGDNSSGAYDLVAPGPLNASEEPSMPEESSSGGADAPSKEDDVDAFDSDDVVSNDLGANDLGSNDLGSSDLCSNDLGSNDADVPKSLCDSESGGGGDDGSTGGRNPEEEVVVEPDVSHSDNSGVEVPRPEVVIATQEVGGACESVGGACESVGGACESVGGACESVGGPSGSVGGASASVGGASGSADVPQNPVQDGMPNPVPKKPRAKAPPVPAPRVSFRATERCCLSPGKTRQVEEDEEKGETASQDSSSSEKELQTPPGFLYKAVALESNAASEDGALRFEQGEVILVLSEPREDGTLKGIRQESWNRHKSVDDHSGTFLEKLIQAEAGTHL